MSCRLHRVPVQRQFFRYVLYRRPSAPSTDEVSKALGVERVVRQKLAPFSLHLAAPGAIGPSNLHFQIYRSAPARKTARAAPLPVVPTHLDATPKAASRF